MGGADVGITSGEGFRDEGLLAGLGGSGRGPLACRSFEKLGFLDAGGGGGAGLLLLLGLGLGGILLLSVACSESPDTS